jgi:hypothetical protein
MNQNFAFVLSSTNISIKNNRTIRLNSIKLCKGLRKGLRFENMLRNILQVRIKPPPTPPNGGEKEPGHVDSCYK